MTQDKKMAAVFHIDDLEKWSLTLGNIKNLLNEKHDLPVEVVVNGPAITGFLENANQIDIKILQKKHVVFSACNNALKAHKIDATDLPKDVTVVSAGVYRIVELQAAGWAYLKP